MPDSVIQGQIFFSLFPPLFLQCPFGAGQKGRVRRRISNRPVSTVEGNRIGGNGAVSIGLSLVGIVIFQDSIRIGGVIASYVLQFTVRTGAKVIVGVVDAGGIGNVVDIGIYRVRLPYSAMAEVRSVYGMAACIHTIEGMAAAIHRVYSRFKAVEGFDEGETEKDDEKRRHPP